MTTTTHDTPTGAGSPRTIHDNDYHKPFHLLSIRASVWCGCVKAPMHVRDTVNARTSQFVRTGLNHTLTHNGVIDRCSDRHGRNETRHLALSHLAHNVLHMSTHHPRIQYDHTKCDHGRTRAELHRCLAAHKRGEIELPVKDRRLPPIDSPIAEKRCYACNRTLSVEHFGRSTTYGYRSECRDCTRFRLNKKSRKRHFKNRYGVTPEQVDAMIEKRKGKCDLCFLAASLRVDHVHLMGGKDGHIRGMLCHLCNANGIRGIDRLISLGVEPDLGAYVNADYSGNPLFGKWGRTNIVREFAAKLDAAQGQVCALCAVAPEPNPQGVTLVTDHDHTSGHVRARVCPPCNFMMASVDKLASLGLSANSMYAYARRGPSEIPDVPAAPEAKRGRKASTHADCSHESTTVARNRCAEGRRRRGEMGPRIESPERRTSHADCDHDASRAASRRCRDQRRRRSRAPLNADQKTRRKGKPQGPHANCDHPATKTGRAQCRRLRAKLAVV
jgi:hypothetical protein